MNTLLQRRCFGELRNNLEVNLVRDRFLVVITSGQEACTYRLSSAEAKELAALIINNLEKQAREALRAQLVTDNDHWYVIQQQDENGQWYDLITPHDLGGLEPTEQNFRTILAQLHKQHPTLTYQLLKEEVIG